MARRSLAVLGLTRTADAMARADERVGVLKYAVLYAEQIDAAVRQKKISAEEAHLTRRHVMAFADSVATGLHVGGADTEETRQATRVRLEGEGLLPGRRSRG